MPLSRNINTYADVEAVLQAARKSGVKKCTYKLVTYGQAVNWRARAYMYRRLLRDAAAAGLAIPGYQPPTAWDDMVLDLTKGSTEVTIKFGIEPLGQLSAAGETVPIEPVQMQAPIATPTSPAVKPTTAKDDELEKEAEELLKRLGVE